jgi:hypothetical protein
VHNVHLSHELQDVRCEIPDLPAKLHQVPLVAEIRILDEAVNERVEIVRCPD